MRFIPDTAEGTPVIPPGPRSRPKKHTKSRLKAVDIADATVHLGALDAALEPRLKREIESADLDLVGVERARFAHVVNPEEIAGLLALRVVSYAGEAGIRGGHKGGVV